MGRPTEVPEPLGTPMTSTNGEHRSGGTAAGTLVADLADLSEPAWGRSEGPAAPGSGAGAGSGSGSGTGTDGGPAPDAAGSAPDRAGAVSDAAGSASDSASALDPSGEAPVTDEADAPQGADGTRPSRTPGPAPAGTPGPARAGTPGPGPADALDPDADPVQAAAVRTDADAAAVPTDTDTDTDTGPGADAPRGGPDADSLPAGDANPDASADRAPGTGRGGAPRGLSTGRRGPVDPVKALMHRHRALCERAVDPLEIAAGLEAHGVTDRTAARYRHRDVFSLAEELFARVPGVAGESAEAPCAPARDIETRAAWSLRALLPGAACLATFVTLRLTDGVLGGGARLAVGGGGALLALVCLAVALRSGPLSAHGRTTGATGPLCCWLLGYVVYGEAFLHQVLTGGPEGPWDLTPAPLLGLAVALAPAAWCAHLFSVHAHRRLRGSRALEEFAAGVRPLLFAAVAAFLCVLAVLLYLAGIGAGPGGSAVGAAALGVLLLLARLLTVHGFPEPAATGLGVACAVEAAAPALVLAGRLPGLDLVARPVRALVEAGGTGAVPALACAAAALGLLVTATAALSRASAHTAV